MSENIILSVGKRGEIYTTKKVREIVGIHEGGLVKATIENNKLIIEPIPSIKELLEDVVMEVEPGEAERISEEMQKEANIYG